MLESFVSVLTCDWFGPCFSSCSVREFQCKLLRALSFHVSRDPLCSFCNKEEAEFRVLEAFTVFTALYCYRNVFSVNKNYYLKKK